jgi:hypothetical protein
MQWAIMCVCVGVRGELYGTPTLPEIKKSC